jgi:nickel/cobalt transporter (NicO) family protein
MIQLLLGSILLSLLHAAIPNHWLPLVLIGRSEGWLPRETLLVAGIAGLAHTLSTIGLGLVIGFIGVELAYSYEAFTTVVAPLVLIFMGLLYFGLDLAHSRHEHLPPIKQLARKSKGAIILSISLAMFFSPCLEIETFYFTAGRYGWIGIATVSVVYLIITISGIVGLVALGGRGLEKVSWHWLEHHEKKVTGFTLIGLGVLSYFIH